MRSGGNGGLSDADYAFIGRKLMGKSRSQACFAQLENAVGCVSLRSTHFTSPPTYAASATPGLPFSTAKVFSVDTPAFGSVTSEITRSRVVICFASTSTLT